MASRIDWDAVQDEILRRLDLDVEFTRLGVRFLDKPANAAGWRSCFARDRDEKHPSAACNTSGADAARGRYVDKGGCQLSLGFFDFAARFGTDGSWQAARKRYAEQVGVDLPAGTEPKRAVDLLDPTATMEVFLRGWCEKKKPITFRAIRQAGGICCDYPRRAPTPQQCLAMPVFGPSGPFADAVNYVLYRRDGSPMELFKGKGVEPDRLPVLTLPKMAPGFLNAHALQHLRQAELVIRVEGPTCMLAVQTAMPEEMQTRHVVIATAFGAGEMLQPWMIERLAGKKIVLFGDADRPGRLGVEKWRASLGGKCDVRVGVLPYPEEEKHGKDVRDFLSEGHSYDDLLALADAPAPSCSPGMPVSVGCDASSSPPASPPSSLAGLRPEHAEILGLLRLHPLGHYPDGGVDLYSEITHQIHRVRNVGRLTLAEIGLYCGPGAYDHVATRAEVVHGVSYRGVDEVAQAISSCASGINLSDVQRVGQGVWRLDGEIVVITGGHVATMSTDPPRVHGVPRIGKHLIDFAGSDDWCDIPRLAARMRLAVEPAWRLERLSLLTRETRKWRWIFPQDAEVCASLVVATWIQTFWPWRPCVSITGSSATGKSSILDGLIQPIFGRMGKVIAKSTEAGIRQFIANRAVPLLVDEFEEEAARVRVLELFRTTSRGGEIYRGTADQRGRKYGLKHIPWTAAIESGLVREADRNRFIFLHLDRIPSADFGKLALPTAIDLELLGFDLLAAALVCATEALTLFEALRGVTVPGVHGRIVESYAVPAALATAFAGGDASAAVGCLHRYLASKDTEPLSLSDENDLLFDILESIIDLGGGARRSVSQILHSADLYMLHHEALERHGVCLADSTVVRSKYTGETILPSTMLFFNPSAIRRHLLRGTRWEHLDIAQLLRRLEGSAPSNRRIDSRRVRGIDVPAARWIERDGVDRSLEEKIADLSEGL